MTVSDTSPLIALARIGRLGLLAQVYGEVIVPPVVEDEIIRHRRGFGGPRPNWLLIHAVQDRGGVDTLEQSLDPGESEAIAPAIQLNARLVIDDGRGRRVAESLGLEVVGTVGTLLAAKGAGIVPVLRPLLKELRGTGFRISDDLIERVCRTAGE